MLSNQRRNFKGIYSITVKAFEKAKRCSKEPEVVAECLEQIFNSIRYHEAKSIPKALGEINKIISNSTGIVIKKATTLNQQQEETQLQ